MSGELIGVIKEERYKGCEEDDGCHCCESAPDPSPLRRAFLLGVWLFCVIDHCLSNVSHVSRGKHRVGGLSSNIAGLAGP